MDQPRANRSLIVCHLFIAALVGIVFGQTLFHGFSRFDDKPLLLENPNICHGLSWSGVRWAFLNNLYYLGEPGKDYWAPITHISHMVDFQIHGFDPFGHHLTNLLLHGINACFLFWLLNRLTKEAFKSFCVALLFAIHPFQTESVSWIIQRKTLLGGFFGLLTIWAYTRYHAQKSWIRLGVLVLIFQLCLMSKITWITVPFSLLLLDLWPLSRFQLDKPFFKQIKDLLVEKLPLLILSIVNAVHALLGLDHAGVMENMESIPFSARLKNAPIAALTYFSKTVWPNHFSLVNTHPGNSIASWKVLLAAFTILILCYVAILAVRRAAFLTVGIFWFLGNLVPVIGIVRTEALAMADRYVYVPIIGLFIMMVWGLAETFRSGLISLKFKTPLYGLGGVILFWICSVCFVQASYWRDEWSLLEHVFEAHPDDLIAHMQVGIFLAQEGKLDDAKRHFEEAVRINPNEYRAHNHLGRIYLRNGYCNLAIDEFQKTLSINPSFVPTRFNLATAFLQAGKKEEAIRELNIAIREKPDFEEAKKLLNRIH